ncbi:MAG: GTPase, partial [Anaerolineae bacterium]
MKLGVIGLPGAGKTTIFNALTQGNAPTGQSMGGRFDVLTTVVDVKDERARLRRRFGAGVFPSGRIPPPAEAIRPGAHRDLASPAWSNWLEAYDAGITKAPAELRHPYFDLRMVEFLLRLPPVP